MVNKRLCEISCNEEEFNKIKNTYEEALDKSGLKNKLKFQTIKPKKKNRKIKNHILQPTIHFKRQLTSWQTIH